jgi:oxygen-independent coproporphyrinogen III oxidase
MIPACEKYLTTAVPRYTSYPTVPHFSDKVDDARYEGWLAGLDPDQPVSLYLHVPFCRQLCWYCGCNMKLASRDAPVAEYARLLEREIALLADRLPARMTISHLHWGGGTPTALVPDDLARLMGAVRDRFDFAPDAEIAIESDPRTLTDAMITRIGALGFNRASFGVQEFDPKVQAAINRIQPPEMVARAVGGLRAAGVSHINFDLIYGLPYQTVDTLLDTIAECALIAPDRLALFGYAHVPWMAKKQRLIPTEALPGAAARLEQAERAAVALERLGYLRVGMDHFALPDDPLAIAAAAGDLRRNFQGYTTDRAETLLGVGSTSIGRLPDGFVQNIAETGAWARAVEAGQLPVAKGHAFTPDDRLRGRIIEDLMCFGRVDLSAVLQEFSATDVLFADELAILSDYARDGVVSVENGVVTVPGDAQALVRVVAAVFDAYLGKRIARHSVAV